MKSIQQSKKQAKELFNKNKKTSVVVAAICIYTVSFISFSTDNLMILFRYYQDLIGAISSMLIFVLGAVFAVGIAGFALETVKYGKSELNTFLGSFENVFNAFLLALFKTLFIFLWSLLFVVPGIIAVYNYRLAEYIMADNPEISPLEAIKLSKKMMQGKKMKLFDLDLSFIGWFILSVITCGIVGLYSLPYYHYALSNFFLDARKEYFEELAFREEWKSRKESGKSEEDNTEEDKKQDEWENYTWEHKNGPYEQKGKNDKGDKTYI